MAHMKRKRISDRNKWTSYTKYGGRCAYCGQSISYQEMQVRHEVLPALGGVDGPENWMPSCRVCNRYKQLTIEEFRNQIACLPERLREQVYIYRLALRYGCVSESNSDISFYFERVSEYPEVEEIQKAERYHLLKALCGLLNDVLNHEFAGSKMEDDIWKQTKKLKAALDKFFEKETHDN